MNKQENPSTNFKVYIDLFNKGELSELRVLAHDGKYSVLLDESKLATIAKNNENDWVKLEGTIPAEKMAQVGNLINLKLLNTKNYN